MKYRWDKKYKYWGITAFLVIAAAIAFTFLLINFDKVLQAAAKIGNTLQGITVGIVIAYLLAPVVNFIERKWFKNLPQKINKKNPVKGKRTVRAISVVMALLFGAAIVAVLLVMILPKLAESITMLGNNISSYAADAQSFISGLFKDAPSVQQTLTESLDSLADNLSVFIKEQILPNMNSVVEIIGSGIKAIFGILVSIFVGVVTSIYLLFNKELFVAQAKRVVYAFVPTKWSDGIMRACAYTHKKIAGFISCQLLDSLIVGVITFIAMLIMGLGVPYSSLIAVVIGATNVIPFFGPFIGAIPMTLVILIIDPVKALIFVIFILVMQQIDGNVINPRIHGSNTGMSGFWVIFSITVGSSLFGFAGMVLSVPVFASLYTGIKVLNTQLLEKKGLPTKTKDYKIEGALCDQPKNETEEGSLNEETV